MPDAFSRLDSVCKAVTDSFPKPVSMAAEKVYEGHLQLGKKRYAGFCHIPPRPPKVDSKGVEKNRLDNSPLVRKMMARVFDLLLVDENIEGTLEYVHKCVADLVQGRVDFADLVITKSISKAEYKSKTVHVEVAKRMKARDPTYSVAPGERIPYVLVYTPGSASKGAKVCEMAEDPLWAIQHGFEINVQHYIKDLSKPLARVLMWYIAPHDMLDAVKTLESADPPEEKALKKYIDRMTDFVANQLFGPGALSDIRRPTPRFTGPMAKFLCKPPPKMVDGERLASLRTQLLSAKAECTKCRGREDDTATCVQRDCTFLFKIALLTKDIEELTL